MWPGKKLLFMGSEFGQSREWSHAGSLDWHLCQYPDHEGIRLLVRDLNRLYVAEPALSRHDFDPRGFRWINCQDADANVIAYVRCDAEERALFAVVCHFGGAGREHRIGVPRGGYWREVINTNSAFYGGTGAGNDGGRRAEDRPWDGLAHSLPVSLPPLTTCVFRWSPEYSA